MRRQRLRLAIAAVAVVAAGLALRFGFDGAVGDLAGGVLYTVLVYLLVAFVAVRMRPTRLALIAFAWSALMELLQLLGVAAALVQLWSPLRLITGASFVWTDLVAYAVGAVLAAGLDAALRRRSGRGSRSVIARRQ